MRGRAVVAVSSLLLFVIGAACSKFVGEDTPAATPEAGTDDATMGHADATANDGCTDVCPELFAANQGPIVALAVDDDTLFWAVAGGPVMSRSFAPLGAISSISGTENAADIAVQNGYLYWTDLNELSRVSKDGGPATVIDTDHQTSVVVDSENVYWSNARDGLVHRLATAHLELDSSTAISLADPNALALDDTYLFVTSFSKGLQAYMKTVAMPAADNLESPADPVNQHHRLAAGGGAVFFRTTAFDLESIAVHTNGARATISGTGHVASHDSDGTNVFWTEDIDGGGAVGLVRRAAADGTSAADLATLQSHPSLIVAGSDHVYWVVTDSGGSSSIMRRPK